ncbi:hypothetical protein RISK_000076 [Rhodopirellula islandica]|uniref:Uncharacterized protein n=1 Tax=Rhodopirellula islandica TaxID=595434 RepID=A0A0J1BN52_RHOIS|nr:hypothetical protein RISK_000076 [Rhodopirellula islandica]
MKRQDANTLESPTRRLGGSVARTINHDSRIPRCRIDLG